MDIPSGYSDSDIAVVGMACHLPDAKNYSEFWKNLAQGKESVTFFTDEQLRKSGVDDEHLNNPNYVKAGVVLDELEMFDAGFFGLSPKEASIMDPQHRHFLECAWEALEDSGYTPEGFNGPIGIFGGCGMNAYFMFNILTNPKLVKSTGLFLLRHTGNDKDFLTTRVSYNFNLTGPSVNVQTACSTSLVAIHLAVQSLLNGECDMALAGGVTIELPHKRGYTYQEGEILSIDGHCRSFDHKSMGTIFGSGTGIVVLRRLGDAIKDRDTIHAIIKSTAINNDGAMKVGYFAPSVDGQVQAIVEALTIADVNPETITYVETHGTGTPIGDPIEITALTQAFKSFTKKKGYCRIGSLKSNIGHLDTAAGVAGFIKTVLSLKNRQIPASLNYEKPNPQIDFENSPFMVNTKLSEWNVSGHPRRAGISSLGVGGTNAHIILEEAPVLQESGKSKPWQLLVWSARNQKSLDGITKKFNTFFNEENNTDLADASFTLQKGRKEFQHRQILVAKNASDASQVLELNDTKRLFRDFHEGQEPSVIFMFPGGGAQYPNMGLELYIYETVYREAIDKCLTYLKTNFNIDLFPLMFPEASKIEYAGLELQKPMNSILSIIITEYALAKMWMSWGINPVSMTGHSMGEYAAACISGVMSLEDALTLVELRGRIFERMAEGGMLSVPLPEEEAIKYTGEDLSIGVINGEALCVLSGTLDAITEAEKKLTTDGVDFTRIKISVAAHSKMLDPFLTEFKAGVSKINLNVPSIPFVSNLSGTWITNKEATSPDYWVNQLRSTVRFADGLSEILKEPNSVFLEAGPGNTLSSLVRSHSNKTNSHSVVSSLRHPQEVVSDYEYFLRSLGKLWLAGLTIDWDLIRSNEKRKRIPLPTYAFDHQPYWIEPGKRSQDSVEDSDPLKKLVNLSDWFSKPVWRNTEFNSIDESEISSSENVWLLFDDEKGLGTALSNRLQVSDQRIILVKNGNEFNQIADDEFIIAAGNHDDYTAMITSLSEKNILPTHIIHLWGVETASNNGILNSLNDNHDKNFFSLLFLAQALGNEDLQRRVKWVTVTNAVHKTKDEKATGFAKAINLGPVKIIPNEFPEISSISVDLEGSFDNDIVVNHILSEFSSNFKEQVIAYRNGQRLINSFEKFNINVSVIKQPLLKSGGIYVFTGGLGGISLTIAKDIASKYKPRLILLSRQQLPAREEWGNILTSDKKVDPQRTVIHKLIELQNLGADVTYYSADVTDASRMENVFSDVKTKYGKINGIVHTAGVIDDGVILFKKKEDAAKVLAPKVKGTLILHELAKKHNSDFLILFSSASSILAPTGQVDYAAANSFIDAFAQANYRESGMKIIALNWGQWQEVGMAARIAQRLGIVEEAIHGKKSEHPLLGTITKDGPNDFEFINTLNAKDYWILNEHQTKEGEYIIPGTGYLELALSSLKNGETKSSFEIKDTFFFKPIILKKDEEKEIKVRLSKEDTGYDFVIMSKTHSSHDEWDENVRGSISQVNHSSMNKPDLKAILDRCSSKQTVKNNSIDHKHMNFGPRWNNLKELYFGQNEALAKIELPGEFSSDLNSFAIHPALLDTATGCAQALAGFDLDKEFYLPFSYSKIVVNENLPQSFYSYIRYRTNENLNSSTAVYDVTIFDESGNVIIEISEFVMKKSAFDNQASSTQHKVRTEIIEGVHNPVNPKSTSNTILQLGQKEGILPSEGAEVFNMILNNPFYPQYIVVSQNLHILYDSVLHANEIKKTISSDDSAEESSRPKLSTPYVAPTNDIETGIAEIWQEVLGVDSIGINDDFLELGGHSLLLTRIVMRVRKKFNVDLSLGNLFETPTIAAFGQEVIKVKDSKIETPASIISAVSRESYRVKR